MKNKIIIFLLFTFSNIPILTGVDWVPNFDRGMLIFELQTAIMDNNLKKIEKILKQNTRENNFGYYGFKCVIDTIGSKININQARVICVLLKRYNVDINHIFPAGTVLTMAISNQDIELIKLFIDLGANVNLPVRDYSSLMFTPLRLATIVGSPKIVQCLIKAGAKLDDNAGGNTALISAASNKNALIIYLLLINGADATIVNSSGLTFLDYIKDKPLLLKLYKEIKEAKHKMIYDTISKANGFNQDMPDVLLDMIFNYDY